MTLFWRCFVLPFFLDFRFKLLTFQNDATRRWNVDTQHKMPKAVIAPIGGCLSHLSYRIGAFYLFWLIIADNVVTLLLCCVEKCTHLMSESQSLTCSFILINGQSTWQSQLKSINNLHKQRPMNVCRLVSPFDINLEHSLCWIVDSAHASCCDTEILLTSIVCKLLKRLHEPLIWFLRLHFQNSSKFRGASDELIIGCSNKSTVVRPCRWNSADEARQRIP